MSIANHTFTVVGFILKFAAITAATYFVFTLPPASILCLIVGAVIGILLTSP